MDQAYTDEFGFTSKRAKYPWKLVFSPDKFVYVPCLKVLEYPRYCRLCLGLVSSLHTFTRTMLPSYFMTISGANLRGCLGSKLQGSEP